MTSPSSRSSPSFKNLRIRNVQSPVEIKEKLRKSYKEKVHSCRNLLLDSLRGVVDESNVRSTLNLIYRNTFNFTDEVTTLEEEEMLAEIREELVKEELDWWLEEYEKYHTDDIDWNAIEAEHVICPVCQKANLSSEKGVLSCSLCTIQLKTEKTLAEVKNIFLNCVEKHSMNCSTNAQFSSISDACGTHIYLMCATCNDMQIAI